MMCLSHLGRQLGPFFAVRQLVNPASLYKMIYPFEGFSSVLWIPDLPRQHDHKFSDKWICLGQFWRDSDDDRALIPVRGELSCCGHITVQRRAIGHPLCESG